MASCLTVDCWADPELIVRKLICIQFKIFPRWSADSSEIKPLWTGFRLSFAFHIWLKFFISDFVIRLQQKQFYRRLLWGGGITGRLVTLRS